jgi:hypothetical protein
VIAAGWPPLFLLRTGQPERCHCRTLLVFAAAATIASLFFINSCATIFRCGARLERRRRALQHTPRRIASLSVVHAWPGGVRHPVGIDRRSAGGHRLWPRPMHAAVRLLSAVAAFPVTGAVAGYGLAVGYWK